MNFRTKNESKFNINITNNHTTNMFEIFVGVLNIAPTKISGQYKIVVDKDYNLWLDDYTGRRVAIDKNISYLEQIANFLQVETFLSDNTILRYGAFQNSKQKSYHIPLYFNTDIDESLLKYFVLALVPNETIHRDSVNDVDSDLYELKYPFKYGNILKVIDLEKIGLFNLFKEINSEKYFKYPLYFNWQDSYIRLFGYGIKEGYPIMHDFNISNIMANQPYFDVFNNKILNKFVQEKIFFPRFINLEFEFDYENDYTHFNNFMGFLSAKNVLADNEKLYDFEIEGKDENGKDIIKEYKKDKNLYIKIQEGSYIISQDSFVQKDKSFIYEQIRYTHPYELDKYLNFIADGTINEIHDRNPQYKFRVSRSDVYDKIIIQHPELGVLFEYTVTVKDVENKNIFESWISICNNCTKASGRNYIFTPKKEGKKIVVTIVNQLNDKIDEECEVILPSYYEILDRFVDTDENYKQFRGITPYDVWLCGQPNLLENVSEVIILTHSDDFFDERNRYKIVDKFLFDNNVIIRLNKESGIKEITRVYIFEDKQEKVIELQPITFMSTYSQLESMYLYDMEKYRKNLNEAFIDTETNEDDKSQDKQNSEKIFKEAFDKFQERIEPQYQYVEEIEVETVGVENNTQNESKESDIKKQNRTELELIDKSKVTVILNNEETIKSMMFNSVGMTSYMTPNILNIEKEFWFKNGCLDSENTEDYLRFAWFLINGEKPKYLYFEDEENPEKSIYDFRSLRYMNRIKDDNKNIVKVRPQITSKLVRITDYLCETIFLGVKYQLPIQYENFDFCVYLNFNEQLDIDLNYYYEVYPEENLIMLSINKYLDFNDLLRGGNDKNEPILDLSFFYNITDSSNQSSDYLFGFKSSGVIFEPFYNLENSLITFNGNPVKDWIYKFNDIEYFCLRRQDVSILINDFTLLFHKCQNNKANTLFIYSSVEYTDFDGVIRTYNYISLQIDIYGIVDVEKDYLWCYDVKFKFFDTKQMFLHKFKPITLEENEDKDDIEKIYERKKRDLKFDEIFKIDRKQIQNIELIDEVKDNIWGDYHKKAVAKVILNTETEDNNVILLMPLEYDENGKIITDEYGYNVIKPISFKENYFEITKTITFNPNGNKIFNTKVFKFKEFNIKGLDTDEKIIEKFDTLDYDESVYEYSVNLFNRNQLWRIIQDMLKTDLKFKYLSENQIKLMTKDYTIDKLVEFTKFKSITIKNSKDIASKYIKTNVVSIDKNLVIWPILNKPKVNLINRIKSGYYPYFSECETYYDFQIELFKEHGTVFNLYDNNFGGTMVNGTPISATGLWNEVQGNIISTLFCKQKDIVIKIPFNTQVNYRNLLITNINYEQCIINNDNKEYLESLNKNIYQYIIESYVDMLLKKFYKLERVENESGTRLPFTVDNKNPYIIHFEDKNKYGARYKNFKYLIFVISRK